MNVIMRSVTEWVCVGYFPEHWTQSSQYQMNGGIIGLEFVLSITTNLICTEINHNFDGIGILHGRPS